MPKWYLRRKTTAYKLYKQGRTAKYGLDIDLDSYDVDVQSVGRIESLSDLPADEREVSHSVGVVEDESLRSATYFQYNKDVVYLQYSRFLREFVSDKLVAMNLIDAIRRYSWLRKYWFRACPLSLDKYTAFVGSHETAGAFIWVREGVKIEQPIQACLFMKGRKMVQVPHNILIAEPYSSMRVITGCVTHPTCVNSAHVACTEIYVKRGADVSWTMIHNWGEDLHVRPRMGAVIEEGGILRLNYVLISPVKSIQMYPTVISVGREAKISFRNLLMGLGDSQIDVGSAIIFNGSNTRGEITTRAIVKDSADIRMRGKLWARKPDVRGHLECRALLLSEKARASAYPTLQSSVMSAELTHEAAVGKIAEEALFYLMSRGLTEEEATSLLARGFLDADMLELPSELTMQIRSIIATTAEKAL